MARLRSLLGHRVNAGWGAVLFVAGCVGVVEDPARPDKVAGGESGASPGAGAVSSGATSSFGGGSGLGARSGMGAAPSGGAASSTGGAGIGGGSGMPSSCTSSASPGAAVPLRRLTAPQVERSASDVLEAKAPRLQVSDERLGTYRSNISSSVDVASARGYLDFASEVVQSLDLKRCESDCREWLFDEVATRLFRRPLSAEQRDRYEALYDLGSDNGGAKEGAAWVLEAMLQSPSFLYLDEVVEADGMLDDASIAARLALALWNRNPDAALLGQAEQGKLSTAEAVEEQAKRLLGAAEGDAGVTEFVEHWLELGRLDDPDVRPDIAELGPATMQAMRAEPTQFMSALVRGGEGITALLTSSQTTASPQLEPLYGDDIVARANGTFSLDPRHRQGILSMPGVVAALSHARRTSPTLRGKAVLTSLLCSPPLPPPAGVDTTLPEVAAGVTTRERIERHVSDPGCAGCHRGMDGIGLSLEKLDWLGSYREQEDGRDIDDRSSFPLAAGDVTVAGAAELASALAQEPEVAACLSRQWLRYASGVSESAEVKCLVEQLASELRGPRGLERMMLTALTSDWIRRGGDVP